MPGNGSTEIVGGGWSEPATTLCKARKAACRRDATRLRLDPATVIKTVVEKEKPEVVNITAMAWLGESDSPASDGVDEGQPFAPKEKEVLVSITFDDSGRTAGLHPLRLTTANQIPPT